MTAETETRRQRLRRELTGDVISSARQQLAEGGPAGVTWRGIARSVGVNPASLYTYFDSLDDVFTAVILNSFERLGEAIQAASSELASEPPLDRLIRLAQTYRRWAIDHPAEFNLIFTDQIPGYAAPPDGPTVAAQTTIFGPLATALAEYLEVDIASIAGPEISTGPDADVLAVPVGLWATMHGLVMLEINNHLPFLDSHEENFTQILRRAVEHERN